MFLNSEIDYGVYSMKSNLKKEQKIVACADKTLFSHWLDSDLRPIISAEANGDEKIHKKERFPYHLFFSGIDHF